MKDGNWYIYHWSVIIFPLICPFSFLSLHCMCGWGFYSQKAVLHGTLGRGSCEGEIQWFSSYVYCFFMYVLYAKYI
ncbi:hypothetical protein B0T13DRAFT_473509 [Neurospora crassa]|nr:hypothetical protein B0T13DRAFT_473509 [Neurospora crassa]